MKRPRALVVPEFRYPPILWPAYGTAVNFERVFRNIRELDPSQQAMDDEQRGMKVSFPAAASAILAWNFLLGGVLYLLWLVLAGSAS